MTRPGFLEVVVGLGRLDEGRVLLDAGVVDEDVAAAELRPGLLDEVLDVGELGDVGVERDGLTAGSLDLRLDGSGGIGVTEEVDHDGGTLAP